MYLNKIWCFFVFAILISSLVFGQEIEKTQEDIDKAAKDLEEGVNKFRDLQKPDTWSFIFAQWKEVLLKNKLISGMDTLFTKINIVFLVLFGMNWGLTLQMFFAFLLWIILFFFLTKYISSVNNQGGLGILYSLMVVVLLAQINLFEYFGKWSVALILYSDGFFKTLFAYILIILLLIGLGFFGDKIIKLAKKKKDKEIDEADKKAKGTFAKIVGAAVEGTYSNRSLGGNPYG